MLTNCLFAGYALGVSGIVYNLGRTKLSNDFESDIRALREYDFSNERINPEKDLPANFMVLAKYNPEDNKEVKA